MPETTWTGSRLHIWRWCLAAAVVVILALAGSPSSAAGCDGYTGDPEEAAAFWSTVSEDGLRACIEAHGTEVRDEEYGGTPLHRAAANASPGALFVLLEAGADLHAESRTDSTPLHWASARAKDPAAIALLLDAGADPMARNDQGWTPLHGAAGQNTNPGATALLIEAGADFEAGVDYKWSAHYMSTPLHLAAGFNDNPTVVTDLIEAGADIESHNYYVGTPLIMAAEFNDNPLVIAALLDAGADQKAQADFNETVWSITMRNPDWVGHLFYGLLPALRWSAPVPTRLSCEFRRATVPFGTLGRIPRAHGLGPAMLKVFERGLRRAVR